MSSLSTQVQELIAESLGVPLGDISIESRAGDPDTWDSMGTMTILLSLERVYGVRLAPGQAEKLQSVRGILELVEAAGT